MKIKAYPIYTLDEDAWRAIYEGNNKEASDLLVKWTWTDHADDSSFYLDVNNFHILQEELAKHGIELEEAFGS